jgi:hypothetical protein
MQKLEGCDDRAMVLDGNQLQVLRYGTVENQYPITEVGHGDVTRDDKGRLLGVFGKPEERVRVRFSRGENYTSLGTTIWVPLERQAEAEAFVEEVNKAIEGASP